MLQEFFLLQSLPCGITKVNWFAICIYMNILFLCEYVNIHVPHPHLCNIATNMIKVGKRTCNSTFSFSPQKSVRKEKKKKTVRENSFSLTQLDL